MAPQPTTTPVFKTRMFNFSLPADVDLTQNYELQLTAVAMVEEDEGEEGAEKKPKPKEIGHGTLPLAGELQDKNEVTRPVVFYAEGATTGSLDVTLRLTQMAAELPSTSTTEPLPGKAATSAAFAPRAARPKANKPPPIPTGGDGGPSNAGVELAHQQALVERLLDDVQQRTAAVAKAGEELMALRGVNKRLESDLTALRAHVDERERYMEQLAAETTNVENIDMPQLQSRHRMLGAAYRKDRRDKEQLVAQVAQLTAALGTQEQLAGSYARLKEAHREQGQQMQRLQEEAKKVAKYRQTAKQQGGDHPAIGGAARRGVEGREAWKGCREGYGRPAEGPCVAPAGE